MDTAFWILLIVLVAWNALLTVGYIVCLRQTVILSGNSSTGDQALGRGSGLALKREIGEAAARLLSQGTTQATGFLFLSPGCRQCREVADAAVKAHAESFKTVLVGVGGDDSFEWLRAAAGGTTDVLLGAAAQTLVDEFDPLPAPFLVVVRGTQIHGWAQISSWTETIAQIDEAERTGTNESLVKGASG